MWLHEMITITQFLSRSNGVSLFLPKHHFHGSKKKGTQHPPGEVLVDISGPFDPFKNGATLTLVCLHMAFTCGLVLIKTGKDAKDKVLYKIIGLATGDVFER